MKKPVKTEKTEKPTKETSLRKLSTNEMGNVRGGILHWCCGPGAQCEGFY